MAKFVINCPVCGKPVQASSGVFAKKEIKCSCGYVINTQTERMTTKPCPHCGNMVTYDRSKEKSAVCPVCHTKINATDKTVKFTCPTCKKSLSADANATTFTCPQCKTLIDVQARVAQEESSGKTSIIQWDAGLNDIFVYRHPVEKFGIGSQLIVQEGQKAIFFKDGKGLDLFGPGRYTLETQKLPLMNGVFDIPTGSTATFDSKVYFIKTNRLKVLWSVPKITLEDKKFGFHIDIGFSGSFEMQVKEDDESARKLVYRIIGTTSGFEGEKPVGGGESYSTEYISEKFRDIVITLVSDLMSNIITENSINILEIDSKKIAISNILREKLNVIFDDYGLVIPPNLFTIPNMRIHNMEDVQRWRTQEAEKVHRVRDEEVKLAEAQAAQGRKLVEEQTEQQLKILRSQGDAESLRVSGSAEADVIKLKGTAEAEAYRAQAMAEAEEMQAKGYTYQQETARQIGVEAMKNGLPGTGGGSSDDGSSGLTNDLVGLGVSLGAVKTMAGMVGEIISPVAAEVSKLNTSVPAESSGWNCSCGKKNITSKFCPDCGSKQPEVPTAWDCPNCGKKGITSNFCPDCGHKKGE